MTDHSLIDHSQNNHATFSNSTSDQFVSDQAVSDQVVSDQAVSDHSLIDHSLTQYHHRHDHAEVSHHAGGHHLLQVEGLSIGFTMYDPNEPRFFKTRHKLVHTIHDLHVSVHAGEIVAIVGASGSGKTLLADAILGSFSSNATVQGRVWFDGVEQTSVTLKALRGKDISLIPQNINSLNPLMKVGRQILGKRSDLSDRRRMGALLERYGLSEQIADMYPHELSGGMARRVLLCCALMAEPRMIVADEPTPGLDPELASLALQDFREFADQGGGVLLITHDIELALVVADRIAVFQGGTVVEETAVANFSSPDKLKHPFSKALWHALPEHDFALPGHDFALPEQGLALCIDTVSDNSNLPDSTSRVKGACTDA